MGLKVLKFGGSSVADGIQLQKMKRIIDADPDRRYVVASARERGSKLTIRLQICYICVKLIWSRIFLTIRFFR